MKCLVVTAMYPCDERPAHGAFVEEQVDTLRRTGVVVDVVHIRAHRGRSAYVRGALRVARDARHHDLVHAHYGLTGLAALRRCGKPLVVTYHGSDVLGSSWQRAVSRLVRRHADATISVSEEIRRGVTGAPTAWDRVIPCGVDLQRFRPGDGVQARAALGIDHDRLLLLFPFDRRRRVKRHDRAAAAAEALSRRLGRPVGLLEVADAVPARMPLYYAAADALILSSDHEGSPTVVKEALACNLPVVATDVGDAAERLRGLDGARVSDPTPEALAAALAEVLAVPRERLQLRRAVAELASDRVAQRIAALYRELLESER